MNEIVCRKEGAPPKIVAKFQKKSQIDLDHPKFRGITKNASILSSLFGSEIEGIQLTLENANFKFQRLNMTIWMFRQQPFFRI